MGFSSRGRKESDMTEQLNLIFFVYMHHNFFICSSVNGHLDYFHVQAINSAAVNFGVHASFQIVVFSGYIGEGNGNPLQYSCLENPKDGGAWWASVHRVAKSRT